MPKIKHPISPQEKTYNKRYEKVTQQEFVEALADSVHVHIFYPDKYQREFLINIAGNNPRTGPVICMDLTEKQADYLAELYERYT